jgi:deferrochelatase/peroxidase EfeB
VESVSRRRLLGWAGAGAAAAGGLAVVGAMAPAGTAGGSTAEESAPDDGGLIAFHGRHQAGVATPAQAHVVVVGLEVRGGPAELRTLLDRWSAAAARLAAGGQVGERSPSSRLPPVDSGEADDRPTARLTITVGATAWLFGDGGSDRFGLAGRRPVALVLPPFDGDQLDPARSGADLCLQVGADDLQVALHAVRNLVRVAEGAAVVQWSHTGFGPPAGDRVGSGGGRSTHRNLLGFREGTSNLPADSTAFADAVWVRDGDEPEWMVDGTYLVLRHVLLDLDAWEELNLLDRERVIGRHRRSGAPISERDEAAPLDLDAEGPDGRPVTDPRSHVAVAHRASAGRPLHRRSYNLAAGVPQAENPGGLLFLAFCRDPLTQFVPLQRELAAHDLLGTYTRTVASEVIAVLPGLAEGASWAEALLDR